MIATLQKLIHFKVRLCIFSDPLMVCINFSVCILWLMYLVKGKHFIHCVLSFTEYYYCFTYPYVIVKWSISRARWSFWWVNLLLKLRMFNGFAPTISISYIPVIQKQLIFLRLFRHWWWSKSVQLITVKHLIYSIIFFSLM